MPLQGNYQGSSFFELLQVDHPHLAPDLSVWGESAAALLAANDELADMRERLDNNDLEKENKIYDLQRMINISSQSSKEHVNALSIAAKKLVKFEDRTKVCD